VSGFSFASDQIELQERICLMTDSVSLPTGFLVSGLSCGIKASGKPDLALFVSECPATAAGVFTQNRVCGAPVIVSRSQLPSEDARAVVINSGNANACTGQPGIDNALAMTAAVATATQCSSNQVLVCSTGIIGVPLPMPNVLDGIAQITDTLKSDPDALLRAATAIMTTDTFPKLTSRTIRLSSEATACITGVAKGAAMIAPNMATMLSVIMTDVRLTRQQAQDLLAHAVNRSFNCISVDGHTSTSDTVLLLANGAAVQSDPSEADLTLVSDTLTLVCEKLATDIIRDAEGADHFITIEVTGLASRDDAFRIAKEIADSPLVKTAITGGDPNWGRIVSAAGYAGVPFETDFVTLRINDTIVYEAGMPARFDATALSKQMQDRREVQITLAVTGGATSGHENARFWTSDLTAEYVRLNSEYTT
jgi:glutamate N-acetyltransferase / amino-acid N-acetyltransferase